VRDDPVDSMRDGFTVPGGMFAWPHLVVKVGLGLTKEAVPHGFQQLWRQPILKQAEEAEEVA